MSSELTLKTLRSFGLIVPLVVSFRLVSFRLVSFRQNQKRQEKLAARRAGDAASRSRCCGGRRKGGQRPPVFTASVQDSGAIATSAGGRPLSDGSSKANGAKGRWGGAGMGVGVT